MSDQKFTEGPWSIWTSHHEIADIGDYYDEVGVKDKNGRQLCVMCGDLDDDTMQANASLMKTSPDMYAMLVDLLGKFRNDEFAPQIEAVLKKARGEE